MLFKVEVNVMPLPELLDPQGKAVEGVMHTQGYSSVSSVRVGKHVQMEVEADDEGQARRIAGDLCAGILSNPVMECFEFSVNPMK